MPGVHNAKNALYASAAAHCYGVGFDRIKEGLKNFVGVNGRLEFLGSKNGKAVYTDYAHHPSEIAATKVALAECGYQSIMAVFEPHTYSRTKTFFDSLSRELSAFDFVAVLPIFAAREQGDEELAENLGQSIAKNSSCCFCSSQRDLFDIIEMNSCDAVVFMGAGRADQIAKAFFAHI